MSEAIRVLMADGQSVYRVGLASILSAEPDIVVVGEANDGPELLRKAAALQPHVILLDILMARCGFEMVIRIGRELPGIKMIILTASEREEDIFEALSAGVYGYLSKTSLDSEIIHSVRTAAAGEVMLSPKIACRLAKGLSHASEEPRLSSRETEVLRLISHGLTNAEISDRLSVTTSTVRTYVQRILEKCNLKNRTEAAVFYAGRFRSVSSQGATEGSEMDSLVEWGAPQMVLPDSPADSASATPNGPSLQGASLMPAYGEHRLVTVLCVEVGLVSFQPHVSLNDEVIEAVIRPCLDIIITEVQAQDGTLAWFTGTGAVCFFGVPRWHEDAWLRAVDAGIAIRSSLGPYQELLEKSGTRLEVRIGLNTGLVEMENSIATPGMEYIPVGNTVKLPESIVEMAPSGGIVVSRSTYQHTCRHFDYRYLGQICVRWGTEPVEVYQLVGESISRKGLGPTMVRGLTPLVGRNRELRDLQEFLAAVEEGRGQVVGIVGEAGMGKSRLLHEFRRGLPQEQYHILEGRCLDYDTGSLALRYLTELLRGMFDVVEGDSEARIRQRMQERIAHLGEGLSGVMAPLREMLGLGVDDHVYLQLDPTQRKSAIIEAVKQLLTRESRNKPVIIVVEDLHWIDKTSEEYLDHLIGWLPDARILLLMVYRPHYTHHWVNKSYYRQIRLDPLDSEQTGQMIRVILGERTVDSEVTNLIINESEGIPFYVEELILAMLELGSIVRQGNRYVLATTSDAIPLPDTIQAVILARTDRLSPKLKRTIQAASVLGCEFGSPVLGAVTEQGDEIISHLKALQGLEFIHEKGSRAQADYVFKHALTQDAIYRNLSLKSRKALHKKSADVIEGLYSDRLDDFCESLAYHYSSADESDKACRYYEMAGRKATQNHAYWESISFYRQALAALMRLSDETDHRGKELALRMDMDIPLRTLTYPEGSIDCLIRCEELAEELGETSSLMIARSNLGWYCAAYGNMTLGRQYAESAFEMALESEDVEKTAMVALNLCGVYMLSGLFKNIQRVAPRVISLLEETGSELAFRGGPFNTNVYCGLLAIHGLSLAWVGNYPGGMPFLNEACRLAIGTNDAPSIGMAEHLFGLAMGVQGYSAGALDHLERSLGAFEQINSFQLIAVTLGFASLIYLYERRLELARKALEAFSELNETAVSPYLKCGLFSNWGTIELCAGNPEKASGYLEEVVSLSAASGYVYFEAMSRVYLGRAWGKMENPDFIGAGRLIREGIAIGEQLELRPWVASWYSFLGEMYLDAGRTDEAHRVLIKAEVMCCEMEMDFWLRRTRRLLKYVENN